MYEDLLAKRSAQKCLCCTPAPRAADFIFYAMLTQFLRGVAAGAAGFVGSAEPGLKNPRKWYEDMEKEIPLVWKKGEV